MQEIKTLTLDVHTENKFFIETFQKFYDGLPDYEKEGVRCTLTSRINLIDKDNSGMIPLTADNSKQLLKG